MPKHSETSARQSRVDVDDLQGSASHRGRADDFADGFDAGAGLFATDAADVGEHRHVAVRRRLEDMNDFLPGRARHVLNAHADTECAGIDFAVEASLHASDLIRRGGIVRRVSALGDDVVPGQRCAERGSSAAAWLAVVP